MDKFLNQFRRIGYDNGQNDMDFSKQEEKLRLSQKRLTQATQELTAASIKLYGVALSAEEDDKQMH